MPTTDPRRFRHRTAEVEAVQWTGNEAALTEFAPDRFATAAPEDRIDPEDDAVVLIEESHWVAIRPGCWVLKYPDHFDVESDADFRAGWVAVPATDRATVRDRVAEALYRREWPLKQVWQQALPADRSRYEALADAVLAVLPPPADRAAVLLEVADWLKAWRPEFFGRWAVVEQDRYEGGVDDAAAELRRMADETQPEPETQGCPDPIECSHEAALNDAAEQAAGGAGGVADETGEGDRKELVVGYRSANGDILRCSRHAKLGLVGMELVPATTEDLPSGGLCTYPGCGADVLIPQQRDTEA